MSAVPGIVLTGSCAAHPPADRPRQLVNQPEAIVLNKVLAEKLLGATNAKLARVAGTPAEIALRATASQVATAIGHERYLERRRADARKAKDTAANLEHYCFVCLRPTDHVGDHDDLVAAGKASYERTPYGRYVQDLADDRVDDNTCARVVWDLTHPVVAAA